jgi:hypothetical protein
MQEEREQPEQTEDVEAHMKAIRRTEEPEDDPGLRNLAEDEEDVEAHMRIGSAPPAPDQRSI